MEGVIDKGVIECAFAHEQHVKVTEEEVVDMQDDGSKDGIEQHVEGGTKRCGSLLSIISTGLRVLL